MVTKTSYFIFATADRQALAYNFVTQHTLIGHSSLGNRNIASITADTLGLIWSLIITPANVQDGCGAELALAAFRESVKFPKVIWADQGYRSVVGWAYVKWLWLVKIVTRPRGRFEIQPKR